MCVLTRATVYLFVCVSDHTCCSLSSIRWFVCLWKHIRELKQLHFNWNQFISVWLLVCSCGKTMVSLASIVLLLCACMPNDHPLCSRILLLLSAIITCRQDKKIQEYDICYHSKQYSAPSSCKFNNKWDQQNKDIKNCVWPDKPYCIKIFAAYSVSHRCTLRSKMDGQRIIAATGLYGASQSRVSEKAWCAICFSLCWWITYSIPAKFRWWRASVHELQTTWMDLSSLCWIHQQSSSFCWHGRMHDKTCTDYSHFWCT